jgi:hypothetical protein
MPASPTALTQTTCWLVDFLLIWASELSQLLLLSTACGHSLRCCAEGALIVALLLVMVQILCIPCGNYFYYPPEGMQI